MSKHHHLVPSHSPAARNSRDVERLGSILSVWAHPDDETYLAAGVMATARDLGQRVVCATATAGEHGIPDPDTWTPARLGRVRCWEAAAAMAVLGVSEHNILGLPDGGLASHRDRGVAWVEQLLDDVAPDTILTFGPDGITFHPDHIAVHHWVIEAWGRRRRSARLLYATTTREHLDRFGDAYEQWGVYMTDQRPTGVAGDELALQLHLDGALLDRKLTALRAMATQTTDLLAAVGLPTYTAQIAEESFTDTEHSARRPRSGHPRGSAPRARHNRRHQRFGIT
jgi:LmbE family N-acetylglucosaminyl deacetylase